MDQQPYDSSLKALFQEEAEEIIPLFLPGATFIEVCDIELIRPTMRIDRAYKIWYRDEPHVFHFEFESSSDNDMPYRLHVYHAILLERHRLPVISIIVYPFRTSIAESPFREMSGSEELLRFPFRKMTLWTEDAEQYVKMHARSMYPLLPAMQGANSALLLQAIEELKDRYKESESKLSRRLLWLSVFLRRADMVPPQDKQQIEERLQMIDKLLEEDSFVQKQRALGEALGEARGEAKGEAKGEARGELQAYRAMVVNAVRRRFPALVDLAQQRVTQITTVDFLDELVDLVYTATDENAVRWLLHPRMS